MYPCPLSLATTYYQLVNLINPHAVNDNERYVTWKVHDSFTVEKMPFYNSRDRRSIIDLDKGLLRSTREVLSEGGKAFACCQHRSKNVLKKFKKGETVFYMDAVSAAGVDQVAVHNQNSLCYTPKTLSTLHPEHC